MSLTYHHVSLADHPVLGLRKASGLSRRMRELVSDLDLQPLRATNAVVAYCDHKIVGFFRYTVSGRKLTARGTCVHPEFQGKGIAANLWKLALRRARPKHVTVWTASYAGVRLSSFLQRTHNHIDWTIA